MKTKLFFLLFLILAMQLFTSPSSAQNTLTEKGYVVPQRGWYFGIEGDMPFGVSTFSNI